ncbi:rCG23323 [Rattus norvegicus]|uniref:RCG23323 n=1 Tax=Rattus norvegicus TaxID=10116 RepID=A6JQ10_RAT|nr:rCG23323 [Rattus norvegicus]
MRFFFFFFFFHMRFLD